jgi:hypothetical protein
MGHVVATEGNLVVVDFGGSEVPLTKTQLAAQLNRSRRWVELRMGEGLPSTLDGSRRMFLLSEARDWLAARQKGAAHG